MTLLSEVFSKELLSKDIDISNLGNSDCKENNSICYADNIKNLKEAMKNENIVAIITTEELISVVDKVKSFVRSEQPRDDFYKLYKYFYFDTRDNSFVKANNTYIDSTAYVSKKSCIGSNVYIGPNVVVMDNVIIEDNVRIDAGATIGTDGILYCYDNKKNKIHISHAGGVLVKEGATILANSNVVKSIFPYKLTEIGKHSIVGIGSIIGHEAKIYDNCVISGNCLVARGVEVEDNSWIGSSSVIREYIKIGNGGRVMAGSVVVQNVRDNEEVSGNFAVSHRFRLKEFAKKLKQIRLGL